MTASPPSSFRAYGAQFHRLGAARAARSAEVVVPLLARWRAPRSVVDLGCGAGAWLETWRRHGARELLGIDQDLVDRAALRIAERELFVHDLARPVRLARRFDLAQSLEVAEHLPPESAAGFVDSLTRLAPLVLFSAAQPGQMGDHHVNEQPPDSWRARFAARGFVALDALRPRLRGDRRVQPWYRHNLLLYASGELVDELPTELRASRVPEGAPLAEFRPPHLRLAMRAATLLPRPAVQLVASSERHLRGALTRLRRGGR